MASKNRDDCRQKKNYSPIITGSREKLKIQMNREKWFSCDVGLLGVILKMAPGGIPGLLGFKFG
jgi:hypothetical protein